MPEDQADKLRRMKRLERNSGLPRQRRRNGGAHRIAVTSGKGGVGKSNFALNCAIALAKLEQRVLLIDADTNLANLDILLGLNTPHNLSDVIVGDKLIREIIVPGPGGIDILPGSSGVLEMMDLDLQVQRRLVEAFAMLEQDYNFIIIDTGAGLTPSILAYVTSADEVVLVTNQEPTSIADAYAMIKVISHHNPTLPIRMMVNLVGSREEAVDVFDRLNLVVQNFLNIPVELLGYLPRDHSVVMAVASQKAFILQYPKARASVLLQMTARKLLARKRQGTGENSASLLERMIEGGKPNDA